MCRCIGTHNAFPSPQRDYSVFPSYPFILKRFLGGNFERALKGKIALLEAKKTPWALNATTQKHFWSKKVDKDNISQILQKPFFFQKQGENRTIRPPRGERKWLEYRFLMQQAAAVLVALLFLPAGKGKGVFYYFWRWASFFSFFCSGK